MSFASVESAGRSEPVELFFFAREEEYWAYTTHDEDIVRLGITYRAALAKRTPFQQSEELNQVSTLVQISTRSPLGAMLRDDGLDNVGGPLLMRLSLTHANDTAMAHPFFGEASALAKRGTYVEVTVEAALSLFRRKLLRVTGGVQCPAALYDSQCGVPMEDYEIIATVASITGRVVAMGSGADPDDTIQTPNYYAGGMLMHDRKRYFIERNDNVGNFTFNEPLPAALVGQTVSLFAGCDRSYLTCQSKFDNTRNFGGFPEFPKQNPFEGTRR